MSQHLNIPIEEFTSVDPITVNGSITLVEVKQLMSQHKIRHIPVMKGQTPVGILSDRDVKMAESLIENAKTFSVAELMVTNPHTVYRGTPLETVVFQMSEKKIGSVLVLNDDDTLMGIFTQVDALNALIEIIRGDFDS